MSWSTCNSLARRRVPPGTRPQPRSSSMLLLTFAGVASTAEEALDVTRLAPQRRLDRAREGIERLERDPPARHRPRADRAAAVYRRRADDPAARMHPAGIGGIDRERPVLPAEQVRVERGEQAGREACGRGRTAGEVDELAGLLQLARDRGEPGAGVAEAEPRPRREVARRRGTVAAQVAPRELGQRRVAVRRPARRAEPVARQRERVLA